jgi:hypothetical protein
MAVILATQWIRRPLHLRPHRPPHCSGFHFPRGAGETRFYRRGAGSDEEGVGRRVGAGRATFAVLARSPESAAAGIPVRRCPERAACGVLALGARPGLIPG